MHIPGQDLVYFNPVKLIKTKFLLKICMDLPHNCVREDRILIVSVPWDVPRVSVVKPYDFNVWAPSCSGTNVMVLRLAHGWSSPVGRGYHLDG